VKIRAVRVVAGWVAAARWLVLCLRCGVEWLVRAARDAGCPWNANPYKSLALGS
jgi:hypothetical protein